MRRAAALALAAVALAGCGTKEKADGGRSGPLAWADQPYRGAPSDLLPGDTIVFGTVENASLREVKLHFRDVTLRDAEGREVPAAIRFTNAPGHGLFPPTREPETVKESEDLRIGRAIRLKPGRTAPLIVSWRADDAPEAPVVLDYRTGRLRLPPAE